MNQHPVPQNVTQYQFRLVGDMTLKQFLELAAGLILAILFYSSNLLFIFKAPLILLSVFFGIALAFFPIEDRPLDQWIINFVNAIYKPTRFTWSKTNKVPSIFTFAAHPIAPTNTITKTIKAPTLRQVTAPSDLSQTEDVQLKHLNALFSALPAPDPSQTTPSTTTGVVYDKPSVTVRKLTPQTETVAPPLNPAKPLPTPASFPTEIVRTSNSDNNSTPADNVIFAQTTTVSPDTSKSVATQTLTPVSLPVPPRSPNLIVGVATTPDGKLVEGAIVQVLDPSGISARAMKTNALGQFATSTPLSPGTYRLEVEADNLTFPAQQLVVNNKIIQPFEIRASH